MRSGPNEAPATLQAAQENPAPMNYESALKLLQHDIIIHLAQALFDGWTRPTPVAYINYNTPSGKSKSSVIHCGELDFYIMRNIGGQVFGVETVITTTQYRRALAGLDEQHRTDVLEWLGGYGRPYPVMEPQHYEAFWRLAYTLGLKVQSLRPAPERPKTVLDLLIPSGRKRTRV